MGKANNRLECESCPSKGEGIFCELESEALHDVDDHKVVNTYKKGQTLFVQGNPPYGMYCISKGNVKVTQVGACLLYTSPSPRD